MTESLQTNRARVLILSLPGRLRDCLSTLLNALPQLETVIEKREHWPPPVVEAEQTPDLVLLDFALPVPEATADLDWIKTNWPLARCLVLVTTAQQQLVAREAGADSALIKGFSVAEFFATIKGLLVGSVTLAEELPAFPASGTAGPIAAGPCPGVGPLPGSGGLT